MLYCVVEPAVLTSGEEEWANEASRDAFLLRLLDTLKLIESVPGAAILWSDVLETELWTSPVAPPWRMSRDMKLATVPVIHRYLQTLKNIQVDHFDLEPTVIAPNFRAPAGKAGMISESEKLISLCFEVDLPWRAFVSVGEGNLAFTYRGTRQERHVVRCERDLANCEHAVNLWWPSAARREAAPLSRLVEFVIEAEFSDFKGAESQLNYHLSERFLDSLIGHQANASQILWAIAKRLAFGQGRSGNDGGLQDESVNSERRFRVNQECRIHYEYRDGRIQFLSYYGEGQHDDGL